MHFTRFPRLSRLLVLFALFQAFAPSVAAIADAWRLDERTPYAHAESETDSGCILVHQHDCALCSAATSPIAAPTPSSTFASECTARIVAVAGRHVPHAAAVPGQTSQRAPPADRG